MEAAGPRSRNEKPSSTSDGAPLKGIVAILLHRGATSLGFKARCSKHVPESRRQCPSAGLLPVNTGASSQVASLGSGHACRREASFLATCRLLARRYGHEEPGRLTTNAIARFSDRTRYRVCTYLYGTGNVTARVQRRRRQRKRRLNDDDA